MQYGRSLNGRTTWSEGASQKVHITRQLLRNAPRTIDRRDPTAERTVADTFRCRPRGQIGKSVADLLRKRTVYKGASGDSCAMSVDASLLTKETMLKFDR